MAESSEIGRILIDADGCPVVDASISLARKYNLECIIFCDTAHEYQRKDAQTIVVDQGPDSVDFALTNAIMPGDVVITQDYGLAAMAISRKAFVFNASGMQYTDANIDMLLASRYENKLVRMRGGRIKGPSKRKKDDLRGFLEQLESFLQRRQKR